jgi:hypothetical protein
MTYLLASLWLASTPADGVSLPALLEQVRTIHPLFSREARRAEIERRARDAASGQEDWVMRATGSYVYENPAPVSPFAPEETHLTGFDLGVERSLWATGGDLVWHGMAATCINGIQDPPSALGFLCPVLLSSMSHESRYSTPNHC